MEKKKILLKEDTDMLAESNCYAEQTKNILKEQEAIGALLFTRWIKNKAELNYGIENNDLRVYNNYIYWAHLGVNVGSEQSLDRPVLVVRTTKESTICTIIPLTLERSNDDLPYHIDLENGKSTALVEQLKVISKKRIYSYHYEKRTYATITENDWERINKQLKELYSLKPIYIKQELNNKVQFGENNS